MRILLTNDDSISSPLLLPVLRRLKKFGSVTTVVPEHEQSWTGKSMTRFDPLKQKEIMLDGELIYTIDGSPADCVNIAVHHLFDSLPDLVVSGVNAGWNAGTSYVLSSGTVGACFEANIASVPAIAFSQHLTHDVWSSYIQTRLLPDHLASWLLPQIDLLLDHVLELLIGTKHLDRPVTWNVNFPSHKLVEVNIIPCSLSRAGYDSCFVKDGDNFNFQRASVSPSKIVEGDRYHLQSGAVTITPIDISSFGQLTTDELSILNPHFSKS